MEPSNTLNRKRTSPFRYGFGMFGTSIPINMLKSYAAAYYVLKLGLITTDQMAKILFIYTFVDAPLMALAFVLFFNMPARVQSDSGKAYLYILLMYILAGTLDSLMYANYSALFPTLFKTDELRAKTSAIRQICQLVAMVISIVLTPVVTSKIGYGVTAVIYGTIALVVILYTAFGCYENIEEERAESENSEKPDLFKAIFALITNGKFWIYGFCALFRSIFAYCSGCTVLCGIYPEARQLHDYRHARRSVRLRPYRHNHMV